jgi:hypothetical protein
VYCWTYRGRGEGQIAAFDRREMLPDSVDQGDIRAALHESRVGLLHVVQGEALGWLHKQRRAAA